MLIIPLIVMIGLFAATKTISIMVDVPVSGIALTDTGEHIYLNLDKNETVSFGYTVSPTNAKNKTVTATAEKVKGNSLAELAFEIGEESITIKPKSAGSAKVFVTTADGGYRASVTVHVESEKVYELQSMESFVEKTTLNIGESVQITHKFNPENPTNANVEYSSSDEYVVNVSEKGVITALRSGTAIVTAKSESNPEIFNVLTITVYNNNQNEDEDGEGEGEIKPPVYTAPPTFSALESEGRLPAPIPDKIKAPDLAKFVVSAYTLDGTDISEKIELAIVKEEGSDYYSITYKFKDEEFSGKYKVEVTYDDGTNDFKFSYENLEKVAKDKITIGITFDNGNEASAFVNTMPRIPFTVSPQGVECDYVLSTSNAGIISDLKLVGKQISYKPISVGVATITIKASLRDDPTVSTEASVKVYSSPRQFNVTAPNATFGSGNIEGIFTLGKYEYVYKYDANGNVEVNKRASSDTTYTTTHTSANKFMFGASLGSATTDNSFRENIRWEVDEKYSEFVYVDKSGVVCFRDNSDTFDEIVEFRAIFGKGSAEVSAVYDIRCVANGINIYSYIDLYRATSLDVKNGISRSAVLQTDIIDDFGYYVNGSGSKVPHYTEMHTTYDDNYYKNIGKENEAKVKVLLEFRNNVYGNGHVINAHNLTIGLLDDIGYPDNDTLFRGPLNLVAMSDNNSGAAVSVKAQDNICFGLYENAKLNNVSLHGATPDETNGLDLTDLNYAGTVVEILGDNTAIEYSRVRYGRTVIRAFGDVNDSEKKINFNVKNTRLSEAREFIVRIGSNRFVEGKFDSNGNENVYAPKLPGASDTTHNTKSTYNTALTDAERLAYDEKFINTTMTVESSIFKNTGLFAIGVDSHFASNALADGSKFVSSNAAMKDLFSIGDGTSFLDSWKNISKTSYGVKVKFVGEVKLDTWKPLADVNSDTLIETPDLDSIPNVGKFFNLVKNIRFDLQKMVRVYNNKMKQTGKTELIHVENSTEYVHGGIVFFGGGKNYSVFDSKEATSSLNAYQISLSEVDVGYLQHAAGYEPFYLFMFDEKAYTSVSEDDKIIFPKND